MNLGNQVVSLELAKKLKELGVKQESLWYWFHLETEDKGEWKIINNITIEVWKRKNPDREVVSAFTVAELGEMLKPFTHSYYSNHLADKCWITTWGKNETVDDSHEAKANTEADARAKMLIYLVENQLITLQ